MRNTQFLPGLTGNQLKIIALIAMTCDHVGLQLLPKVTVLRIIGRLAFPIFAYMIAEGCQHTHNRKKYLLAMWGLAATCQAVYFFAMGSLYMCVLVTFALSIVLNFALDYGRRKGGTAWLVPIGAVIGVFFLSEVLPRLLPGTDYAIDYGFRGILLPVFVYMGRSKAEKLTLCAAALCLLALDSAGIQWWSLAVLPLLALYNGKRGKYKMKYLFYIYYPLHLVVIEGLRMIL